jgi:hypothetical protein
MAQALEQQDETPQFATEVLEVLRRCGWDVGLTKAFGSTDDLCLASKGTHRLSRTGKTPLEAAHALFKACNAAEQLQPAPGPVQLRLA